MIVLTSVNRHGAGELLEFIEALGVRRVLLLRYNIGGAGIPLPETAITKGRDSRLKLTIDKGAVNVDEFRLAGGDLGLDLKGKVFLSTVLSNYRLNLTGSFAISDKLGQAIPFLFMAEKQKQADGSYPLTITGRLSEPAIKVGTFTLPL